MITDVFRILVFAAYPLLFLEVFLVVEYSGWNEKFDRILMPVTYATIGFILFGSFAADGWIF